MSLSKQLFSLAKTPIGDLIVGLAFGKFSSLLPVKKIKETELVIAFWHPKPFWEKHILIVPKKAIPNLETLRPENLVYIQEVFRIAQEIVRELRWDQSDYFVLTNGGTRQEVNQLHFHLGSGQSVSSPY